MELSDNETNAYNYTSVVGVFGPEYHRQVRVYMLASMITVSCFGNLAVCCHIRRSGSRRTRVQILFFNLAFADLLVTFFAMVSQLVWETMDLAWVAGDAACKLFKVFQTFTMVSSNYILLAIALDRFCAIIYPLGRRPRIRTLLIAAWLCSTVPSLPNAYIFQVITVPSGETFCVAKFYTSSLTISWRQRYMAFIFLSVFVIPIVMLVGLYARILVLLWSRTGQRRDSVVISAPKTSFCFCRCRSDSKKKTLTTDGSLDGQSSVGFMPRAKVKTLKMTLVVVVAFLATCLPYLVQEMILAFGDPSVLNQNVVALSGIISASNSCLNPYIYIVFNWGNGVEWLESFKTCWNSVSSKSTRERTSTISDV